MTSHKLVRGATAGTLFSYRLCAAWLCAVFLFLVLGQRDAHLRHSLKNRCLSENTTCDASASVNCVWQFSTMGPSCRSDYDWYSRHLTELVTVSLVCVAIELLCSFKNARQSALNCFLLLAHVLGGALLICFVWQEARWWYLWAPVLLGVVYPVAAELFFTLSWHFGLAAMVNLVLALIGGLVMFIVYWADSGFTPTGWVPFGWTFALLAGWMTSLATRAPIKYALPESATELMA